MRIALIAFGTRGDVQPALALAKGLRAKGHEMTIVAGSNFESWVRGYGFDFVGTLDQEAVMQSSEGIAWVEEVNPLRQLGHMKALLDDNRSAFYAAVAEPAKSADLLLSGFVSEPFAQAASEKFGVPQVNVMLQPYRPTRSGAASLNAIVKGSSIFNRWGGLLGERLIWWVGGSAANYFREELGLQRQSAASYLRSAHATPTLYGFSPQVVPPPDDWGERAYATGYWFLDEQADWQPPADLTDFLAAGEAPIYVGFGSMPSRNPQQTHGLILDALRQTGRRAVVAGGWGGSLQGDAPDFVHFLDHVPHEWLLPRAAAVVHHGGAGTTAAGLRAGKPTLIIPHLADQPYWGRRVHELGVGAKPIPRQKLTVEALAAGIRQISDDQDMKQKAAALGAKIRAEDGVAEAVRRIEQFVG